MDLKFIILLVALIALGLFLMSEMHNLKKEIQDGIGKVENMLEQNIDLIRNKMQSDNLSTINKIKLYNEDLIDQIRRINQIEGLPIQNMSNHYTECNSDDERQPMPYLSDIRGDIDNQSIGRRMTRKDDMYQIVYPRRSSAEDDNSESSHSSVPTKTSSKGANTDSFFRKNNMFRTHSNSNIKEVDQSSSKSLAGGREIDVLETLDPIDELDSSTSIVSSCTTIDIDLKKSFNSKIDEDYQSLRDNITMGSTKKGTKPLITTHKRDDDMSVASTVGTLAPMESYNLDQLKNLAKQRSIPITHVINGTRKQLKKDELYKRLLADS